MGLKHRLHYALPIAHKIHWGKKLEMNKFQGSMLKQVTTTTKEN